MEVLNRMVSAGLGIAATASICFAWLAYAVMHNMMGWFDDAVRGFVHSWASPMLTRCFEGITELGSFPFLMLLGLLVAWTLARRRRYRAAVILAVSALGAQGFDQLLKGIFRRTRPEAFFGVSPHSYSFPSGHSVESCCFYGVLAAIVAANTRSRHVRVALWVVAASITLAVGTSRIYLGVHYPTDVLGGYIAGVAWVALVWTGYQVWRSRRDSVIRLGE
jgi:undecaprenyl-diphosphatase